MNNTKNIKISYLLWLLLGILGAHHFYLERPKTGAAMLILGLVTAFAHTYIVLIAILAIWWLIDAALIPGYVEASIDQATIPRTDASKPMQTSAKYADLQQLYDLNAHYLICAKQGDIAGAIEGANAALTMCEDKLGKEHSQVGTIKSHLGGYYRRTGNNPQAVTMLRSAISIQEQNPDQDISIDQAQDLLCQSLDHLAHIYTSIGQIQEAKGLYRRIIDILTKPNSSSANTNTHQNNENSTPSEKAAGTGKSIAPPLPRPEKHDVRHASALNSLALLYSNKGQAAQAQPLFEQASTLIDNLPLEKTELKVEILKNYAAEESALQHYEHSEKLYQRAIETLDAKSITLSMPVQAKSTAIHASTFDELDIDYSEPEHANIDDGKSRTAAILRNHLQTAACYNGLGIIYTNQNKLDDAENTLTTAATLRKEHAPNDPDFLIGLSHLSLVYFKQEKFAKAEAISRHILAIRTSDLGIDHADTQRAQRNLDAVQTEMRKHV